MTSHRSVIGHNQPSFDAVVEENLLRGLHLTQLNCLMRAVEDPRLSPRDLLVLCQIIKRTNDSTGVAYPGRSRLAADVVYYASGEPRQYSEATIATSISVLKRCGYLMEERRAPPGGGRALAHYTTVAPPIEELQRQIAEAMAVIREAQRRKFPAEKLKAEIDRRVLGKPLTLTPASTSESPDVDTVVPTVRVYTAHEMNPKKNIPQSKSASQVLGCVLSLGDRTPAVELPYLEQLDEIFAQAKTKRDLDRAWAMEERDISALPRHERHKATI